MKPKTLYMGQHEIEVVFKALDGEVSVALDNVISAAAQKRGNYQPGVAKSVILVRGIKSMKIDGEPHKLGSKRTLPAIVDPDKRELLFDRLIREILALPENQFVLWNDDYLEVFEEYSVEDEDEELEENPT